MKFSHIELDFYFIVLISIIFFRENLNISKRLPSNVQKILEQDSGKIFLLLISLCLNSVSRFAVNYLDQQHHYKHQKTDEKRVLYVLEFVLSPKCWEMILSLIMKIILMLPFPKQFLYDADLILALPLGILQPPFYDVKSAM